MKNDIKNLNDLIEDAAKSAQSEHEIAKEMSETLKKKIQDEFDKAEDKAKKTKKVFDEKNSKGKNCCCSCRCLITRFVPLW